MKSKLLKRIIYSVSSIVGILLIVLAVHIYQVKQSKLANKNTIALARIDIKQPIEKNSIINLQNWFANKNGIQQVVYNAEFNNIVFAYKPTVVNADALIKEFIASSKLNAIRYMPTAEQMKQGCPAM